MMRGSPTQGLTGPRQPLLGNSGTGIWAGRTKKSPCLPHSQHEKSRGIAFLHHDGRFIGNRKLIQVEIKQDSKQEKSILCYACAPPTTSPAPFSLCTKGIGAGVAQQETYGAHGVGQQTVTIYCEQGNLPCKELCISLTCTRPLLS